MNWIVYSIIYGVALAMDCLALSIVDGLVYAKEKKSKFFLVAAFFGLFQGLFPLIGFLLGTAFSQWIDQIDHWIGFGLLLFIGGKMVYEGIKAVVKKDEDEQEEPKPLTLRTIILQSVADSIDAFAIGITIKAFIHLPETAVGYEVYVSFAIIAVVTFVISLGGLFGGKFINKILKGKSEATNILGGVVLVTLGILLLLEGLNIIG